ncbi:hypothetical protein [Bradyrhizobium sp. dw_78]|uniref:hypothetical protein n=1 Tax=Bradyrhizobium sp. dw_78 TaxID=2719793 RepID=UPI001BD2BE15|nr:hypothetical protein [Bradyrhizobium sp. dw_78]
MLSFILDWIGISADYLVSGLFFVGGGFLAFYLGLIAPAPFSSVVKWIGYVLMIIGVVFGFFSYGRSVGAADCYAAWHKADVAFEAAKQNQEANAGNVAASTAAAQAQTLTKQNDDLQKQIQKYQSSISPTATCRLATVDDDRRMCHLVGNGAAGCKNSK